MRDADEDPAATGMTIVLALCLLVVTLAFGFIGGQQYQQHTQIEREPLRPAPAPCGAGGAP